MCIRKFNFGLFWTPKKGLFKRLQPPFAEIANKKKSRLLIGNRDFSTIASFPPPDKWLNYLRKLNYIFMPPST